jgi:hypothetical protein
MSARYRAPVIISPVSLSRSASIIKPLWIYLLSELRKVIQRAAEQSRIACKTRVPNWTRRERNLSVIRSLLRNAFKN